MQVEELNNTGELDEYLREIEDVINDKTLYGGETEEEKLEGNKTFILDQMRIMEGLDSGKREYVKDKLSEMLKNQG